MMTVEIKEPLKTREKGKIAISKINVEQWMQMVENEIQQTNVNSFEKLAGIIVSTKTSCTTQHIIKKGINNGWIWVDPM